MHINGKPILSRSTITAGRSLCGASLVLILTELYSIDLTGLKVFEVPIEQKDLARPAAWLLLFLAVGYFLNWFGDVYSFRGWNKPGDKTGSGTFGYGGASLQTEYETALTNLNSLHSRVIKYEKAAEEDRDADKDRAILQVAQSVKELSAVIDSVKQDARRISVLGRLTLYGWHGLVPLGDGSSLLMTSREMIERPSILSQVLTANTRSQYRQ